MMNHRIDLVTLLFFGVLSLGIVPCRNTDTVKGNESTSRPADSSLQPDTAAATSCISVGSAGGFTGGGSEYLLYGNGRAELHWRATYKANDSLLARSLADTAKLAEFRTRLQAARGKAPHGVNKPKSFSRHIAFTDRDSTVVWTWGLPTDLGGAAPELNKLYDDLTAYGESLFPNPLK